LNRQPTAPKSQSVQPYRPPSTFRLSLLNAIAVRVLDAYVRTLGRKSRYGLLGARATEWFHEQEAALTQRGRPLTATEFDIARRAGVRHPEKVRVLVLAKFPLPSDPLLAQEAEVLGFGSEGEAGRSMGYAVLVKPRFQLSRQLLTHELVHVAQRERLGADGFVRRYLLELKVYGYDRSPMEAEANRKMNTV
jgi:hypothetical protein